MLSVAALIGLKVGEGVREPPSVPNPHALNSSSTALDVSL